MKIYKADEIQGNVKSISDVEADLLIEKKRADVAERKVRELQEANRWIPVTERLPENNQHVLVYIPNDQCIGVDHIYTATIHYGRTADKVKNIIHFGDVFGNNEVPYAWNGDGPKSWNGQKVIAWQPLPAPPEQERT